MLGADTLGVGESDSGVTVGVIGTGPGIVVGMFTLGIVTGIVFGTGNGRITRGGAQT